MTASRAISPAALLAAIVAVMFLALAAVIFVANDDAGSQRLATFLALVAVVLPALIASLRSDQGANRLNGDFDKRVVQAVLRANFVRRQSDVTPENASPAGRDAIDNPSTLATPELEG